jgi:hypothetical protein
MALETGILFFFLPDCRGVCRSSNNSILETETIYRGLFYSQNRIAMLSLLFALVVASRGAFVVNEAIAVLGQPSFSTSSFGLSNSSLNAPKDIVIDEMDNLYVADTGNLRVLFFERDIFANRFVSSSASRVYGANDQQSSQSTAPASPRCRASGYQSIEAIALDPRDGALWVSDGGASCVAPRIWVYPKGSTRESQVLTFSVCGSDVIQSMAFASPVKRLLFFFF